MRDSSPAAFADIPHYAACKCVTPEFIVVFDVTPWGVHCSQLVDNYSTTISITWLLPSACNNGMAKVH